MATNAERAQAIGNALLNATATPSQLNRLGEALASAAARLSEYNEGTNSEKAGILVEELRRRLIALIRMYEEQTAVDEARTTVQTAVETGFSEAE